MTWLRRGGVLLASAAAIALSCLCASTTAQASTLPPGFSEQTVFSGLTQPTAIRFSPDGRVFVAEKSGLIKVFDSLSDPTPTVFADLRTEVHNFWDRGLLGIALDPGFPEKPYVYALYTHDAAIGGTAPRWGTAGETSDGCPTPPGPTTDGCEVSGRLVRLTASGDSMVGSEKVLIEDWCQQFPSHSIGTVEFGPGGALYVSAGDGASFGYVDYGQTNDPCGDPTNEGGALRAQDMRTTGDPQTLDGTLIRVDPATGAALPGNPDASSSDPNARRIIAYGFRNPFRFAVRPGTSEIWIGDVGWNSWEEVDRLQNPTGSVKNFGWPCYEGTSAGSTPQPGYDAANLSICENLYAAGPSAVQAPFYSYNHSNQVVPGESCPTGSSSISGMAFGAANSSYPSQYHGALFFADYSRDCIWAMLPGSNGVPDPSDIVTFAAGAGSPVQLQVGPDGDLYYVDLTDGTIQRISYSATNQPPTAVAKATPTSGDAPLNVQFDGSQSSDPDAGDTLSYSWDLNGDGQYGDSTAVSPSYTYTTPGVYTASLRVTDSHGESSTSAVQISVGNSPPKVTITTPGSGRTWHVGSVIDFAGGATDPQDGQLPASDLSWSLLLHHCPSNCHTHFLQTFDGVASGSFTAPDHEYPSHLELKLTATDSGGLTASKSVELYPQTTDLTFASSPTGLQLAFNGSVLRTPFTKTVIRGSLNTISAPSPQTKGANTWSFKAWSDGRRQTHDVIRGRPMTYTATYKRP